ncbi:MAG: chemotaxis response regulator protein-glutamate methylesterase [Planctomycetales bacterium]|nr:chemotaxis response regulator protein-glutamate methylesterase [bacterium]UNM08331.1 MAG: chemotaxis response regulator protein-glutamate methylesterase [Planctomycetales bacterium]
MSRKHGILIVDDSAFMRKVISEIVSDSGRYEVVDTARDGIEALEKLQRSNGSVDLVTLDINMPKMDGLACLREIMKQKPTRVVMVSSLTSEGAQETIQALEDGAVDFICKPGGSISVDFASVGPQLMRTLDGAMASRVPTPGKVMRAVTANHRVDRPTASYSTNSARKLVAIASSTGGPKALSQFLPGIPADIGAAMLVVQHMPAKFTALLAERLNSICSIKVKEAEEGDRLTPGLCLIAPGGRHLEFNRDGVAVLNDSPAIGGLRPCADLTFRTLAQNVGKRAVGVVLTGMGKDGTEGCNALKKNGCRILAESKETALIYGMPRSVIESRIADAAYPINELPQAVVDAVDAI